MGKIALGTRGLSTAKRQWEVSRKISARRKSLHLLIRKHEKA